VERALCPVLVGREAQLSQIEDALLAANRGDGQIVILAGEAGVRKTRLAAELQRRALKLGMAVLRRGELRPRWAFSNRGYLGISHRGWHN
jgi:MoxR-like ATPase